MRAFRTIIAFVCAFTLAAIGPACAQTRPPDIEPAKPETSDALKISGTIRLRYETIEGQARAGFNSSDDLANIRTTLLATYDLGPLAAVAELYDSRAYGANRRTPISTNEVNTFELVQAYIGTRTPIAIGDDGTMAFQAGRMLLNIGSRRLVAADDYRNTTNSYTGLRADLAAKGGVKATLIYVLPQSRRPDDLESILENAAAFDRESFDLVLWGGTASKTKAIGAATAELSFYHLGERDAPGRPTRNRSLETIGGRIFRDPAAGRGDYEIEGFYQFGTIRGSTAADAARQDVSAWFIHADTGYTFNTAWKPRLSIEFDRASGDGPGGRFGRFDTVFGMRRADFAPSGLFNAVTRANIVMPGLRLEAVPNAKLDLFASYRAMWLAARTDGFATTGVRDATGRAGDFAGHQIDARIRYWLIADIVRAELDATLLAKGRFLREAPNAPTGKATRYVSMNLTFSF